ncbi:MAG: hypothetical protein A4S09_16860 [Proteobacteria bacterium SG_bin7]|nr:MAG: hypothetical protein A4S09_16860 [Proteobacteria bacterium SG_bin7]
MSSSIIQQKSPALILLFVYIGLRFIYPASLDQIGPYAPYAFEVIFCINAVYLFRSRLKLKIKFNKTIFWYLLTTTVAGFCVFSLALPLGLFIPFNLKNPELIFLLIVIGPILEEFIFRFAFWHALEKLFSNKLALPLTTVIFSYSHFQAYFLVPADFKHFVIYQTIYTLFLGWWLGSCYRKYSVLSIPILFHIVFNLGFLVGFFCAAR